jgi:hypothetical protein
MSGDSELERYLALVRVVGPPADLRSRILSGAAERRAWPWMVAAAAVLCVSLALHGAVDRHAAALIDAPDAQSLDVRVERITNLLGSGSDSRRLATFIVTAEEVARRAEQLEERR